MIGKRILRPAPGPELAVPCPKVERIPMIARTRLEDSFDDIGFTDISLDDNLGCEQNKRELDSDCESESELEHDVDEIGNYEADSDFDEINPNPRHADRR